LPLPTRIIAPIVAREPPPNIEFRPFTRSRSPPRFRARAWTPDDPDENIFLTREGANSRGTSRTPRTASPQEARDSDSSRKFEWRRAAGIRMHAHPWPSRKRDTRCSKSKRKIPNINAARKRASFAHPLSRGILPPSPAATVIPDIPSLCIILVVRILALPGSFSFLFLPQATGYASSGDDARCAGAIVAEKRVKTLKSRTLNR